MKHAAWIATGLAAAVLVSVACGDLFHSTSFDTLCTADAATPGCPHVAVTELCTDSATALARAERACAWLAACETPMGENRTGQCIANALMAYDCNANPNRQPTADARQFWLALASASNCEEIAKAIAPDTCSGAKTFVGCAVSNPNVRIQCSTGSTVPTFESCPANGKSCAVGLAQCLGKESQFCSGTRCSGHDLIDCDNDAGLDHGVDCSQLGDGTCVATGAAPSCKPSSSIARAATTNVICDPSNVAIGSITGFEERVDCKVFAGVVDGGAPASPTCAAIDGGGAGTSPRDACQGPSGCKDDSCDKTVLRACVQGNEIRFDCRDVGLTGGCDPNAKTQADGAHAACKL